MIIDLDEADISPIILGARRLLDALDEFTNRAGAGGMTVTVAQGNWQIAEGQLRQTMQDLGFSLEEGQGVLTSAEGKKAGHAIQAIWDAINNPNRGEVWLRTLRDAVETLGAEVPAAEIPRDPAPTVEGEEKKKRPCYDRDVEIEAYVAEAEEQKIRNRWAYARDKYNKAHPEDTVGKGRAGRDVVRTATLKVREARGEF